ncbi:MAG TPA: methyltransferase domain-containing protein [Terracidiphilus sp.]|jgi:SAM-dependent methyltransferase|nr:methyltransferase domain-containing protein [Terracidiphilus sp.]
MPHSALDFSRRAQLSERMDEPCTREELRACLHDISRLNQWLLGYRPTLDWMDSLSLGRFVEPIRILDVGCGYGDTLRRVEQWARQRGIAVELIGLDLNPDATAIAAEVSAHQSHSETGKSQIEWVAADVFSYDPAAPVHLVISSLFAHHLSDSEVVRFVRWMERQAVIGWFINDLSRAAIPYHLLGWFSGLMRLHPFVRNDGPVSILRAFQPQDWRRLCASAGLAGNQYTIVSYKPARLCVSRGRMR